MNILSIVPKAAGGYRVFACVYNDAGASVGNVPFLVTLATTQAGAEGQPDLPQVARRPN